MLRIARIIGPHVGHVVHPVGDQPVVGVEPQPGAADQVAARIVRQHRLGPVAHPADRLAQFARRMRHQHRLGIIHPLHAKSAAHIGVGHAHRRLVDAKRLGQLILHAPDTLPVHADVQPVVLHLGPGPARFHRRTDDAVVVDRQVHDPRRLGQGRVARRLVALGIVIDDVVRGLGVDRRAAIGHVHLDVQLLEVDFDGLRRIARLLQRLGHDHRDALAHEPHTVPGQQRPLRVRRPRSVAILRHRRRKVIHDACRLDAFGRQHGAHTVHCLGFGHVQRSDIRMRHGRTQDIGMQRPCGRGIVNVSALSGQKPGIFSASCRLAQAKLVHGCLRTE